MKKILLNLSVLLVVLVGVVGCNKDDNSSDNTSEDSIVGKWNLKYQKMGDQIINDNDCHHQSFIQWNSDMTANGETHLPDQDGDCIMFTSFTGTWEKLEGNTYKRTDNASGASIEEEIIFIDNNNMYIDYQVLDFYYGRSN